MAPKQGGFLVLIAAGLLILTASAGTNAQPTAGNPAARCRRLVTDDTLQPISAALVPVARRLFGLAAVPSSVVQRTTVSRCMDGALLLCNTGANLPCGKANVAREIPAADAWCRERPDAPMIPMVVTGHDTIYRWRCAGARARADGPVERVDERGFITRFWKRLD